MLFMDKRSQTHVLEAVIVAIMMLVAISFVVSFSSPTYRQPHTRTQLERLAGDKLQNLYLASPDLKEREIYGNLLTKFVTEAATGNPKNLTENINATIKGAYYNVYLSNGQGRYPLYVQGEPPADAVSASQIILSPWSYAMVFTDLDIYDIVNTTQMTVWAIPVYKSSIVKNLSSGLPVVFSNGVVRTLIEKTPWQGIYEKTGIPPDTVNSSIGYDTTAPTSINSSFIYRGTPLQGRANYTVLIVGGVLKTLTDALNQNCSISVTPRNATIGMSVNISYNFSSLSRLQNVTFKNATVNIYGPIMGRIEKSEYLSGNDFGYYLYKIPKDSIYGPYVVEIQVRLLFGSEQIPVMARLVDYFVVTLPDGSQPSSPAYEVQLVMWYPEW